MKKTFAKIWLGFVVSVPLVLFLCALYNMPEVRALTFFVLGVAAFIFLTIWALEETGR